METKFKIGDKVIITKSAINWHTLMDRYVGRVLTIKKMKGNGLQTSFEEFKSKFGTSDNHMYWIWNANQHHFKHYQEEPILNNDEVINNQGCIFKIGDKVKYSKRKDLKPFIIQNFETYQNGQIRAISRLNNKIRNCNIDDIELVIKDEFVLPEKWCIKANNKEESKCISKYLYPHIGCIVASSYTSYYTPWGFYGDAGHNLTNYWKYPEITFEQFKKYVLNK